MSAPAADTASTASPARWPRALAVLGAWAMVVPYLATALGLELDVAASTELVDHVVPGAVAVACGLLAARDAARGRTAPGELTWLLAGGAAFLAGFWITATHVALLVEASQGIAPWGTSLLHLSAGPPVALVAARMLILRGG